MLIAARPAVANRRLPLLAMAVVAVLTSAANGEPAGPAVESLTVEPAAVALHGSNCQQQLLATGTTRGRRSIDLTRACTLTTSDTAIAVIVDGCVVGVRDGVTEIRVTYGNLTAVVPVRVRNFASYPPVDFATDLVPLFSKHGCNGGGCHGKASGQNGFRLSVFGFDPAADFDALVKEARGRRVFAASPDHSLVWLKATGQVAHGGGRRVGAGTADAEVFRQWLTQGMPASVAGAAHVLEIRVRPTERILGLKAEQQIVTTAVFSDGSLRDVTAAAAYTTNASLIAEADARGRVRTGMVSGEAAITVQYMGHVAVVRFQVPRPDAPDPYPTLPVNNRIDELVWAKLRTMGIVPSELSDDATFFRRASLDAIGTLPSPTEARAFLADRDPAKRAKVIDRLLDRPEYAAYWGMKWADVLLVNREKLGDRGAYELHRWLVAQMTANRPYDQWVRELIASSGSSYRIGPVNFYRAAATPEEHARNISQAFLGVRLECAQCHHHPFEKWGQEDFYGLAGFFDGLKKKKLAGDEELVHHPGGAVGVRIGGTGRVVPVRPPGGPVLTPEEAASDPRQRLAAWVTGPGNPWFARLAVNRLWKHFLGRGLVEPEDDLRSTNPATNEGLLEYLTKALVENRYDLKAITRLTLNSRAYQLSSTPNVTNMNDEQYGSHYRVRRLPAEVLLDAIGAATGVPEAFPGRSHGTRAIDLWDNRAPSYFLDVFGRSERLTPCECGRTSEPTMAQCLHLLNAPEVESKIASLSGRVAGLLAAKKSPAEIAEELCLAALGRPAGEKEKAAASRLFAVSPPAEAAQDFLWALLNSYDFLFSR